MREATIIGAVGQLSKRLEELEYQQNNNTSVLAQQDNLLRSRLEAFEKILLTGRSRFFWGVVSAFSPSTVREWINSAQKDELAKMRAFARQRADAEASKSKIVVHSDIPQKAGVISAA